jgi:hypothetical protein
VQAPHWATPQPYLVPVKPDLLAQHPEERRVRLGFEGVRLAVDVQGCHGTTLLFGKKTGQRL